MAGPVDTTPLAQGKRKRTQKNKTPVSQGSKRVKSVHDDVQDNIIAATPVPKSQKIKTKSNVDTPTAPTTPSANALALQAAEQSKRLRRHPKTPRRRSAAAIVPLKEEPTAADAKGSWLVSRPTAGRLIAHDPIVSSDDSYVFASNGREVQVLSVATSLVERTLPGPDNSVTAFSLSPSDPETIYIASASRRLQCWEWISGAVINDPIEYKGKIHAVCAAASDDASEDILYTICQVEAEWQILAGDAVIYTSQEPLSHLSIEASYIMAASPTKLVVGRRTATKEEESTEGAHFSFVEVASPIEITCLAGRSQPIESKKKGGPSDLLTVAAGNVEGQIMVYDDLFSRLGAADATSLMPRILHWHREAVASLKWSQDGSYIVSGGRETTLVLWQLATGKKQFLPHLTAEIERLTVSPSGTSYAVQLADNSVMLLSTTELKPIANFAGLQAQTTIQSDSVKHVITAAAVLDPTTKDQLLIAVPPSQATSSRPFLQTYDITNDRHISRQAITRNNVTDFNKGPEGNKIKVPDVIFMKISEDGQWLATVEEWSPPARDVDFLSSDRAAEEQRSRRREVYLKIWGWIAEKNIWSLETRIDNPHQIHDGARPGRVLNLVSDPVDAGFATIGEDSSVRIWKPKTRLRNGLVVRGANAEGLVDWSCRHTIELDRSVELADDDVQSPTLASRPKSAALAYSEDASMLAASQVFEETSVPPVVNFINTTTGEIEQTRANLFTGTVKALDFLDRHLIVVSDSSIHVWDVINEILSYRTGLAASTSTTVLLAVNHDDRNFAISLASSSNSRIRIYNTSSAEPELARDVQQRSISALLTVPGRKGYTVLTTAAEIYSLSPKISIARSLATSSAIAAPVSTEPIVPDQDDEDIDMEVEDNDDVLAIDDEEADKPVVRPEQLAQVFDAQNVALMPVRDMFEAVVGLYARKPRVDVGAAA